MSELQSGARGVASVGSVGIFDAHCHPTDVMASIDDIGKMYARGLTIMASRSQDQHLVAEAASRYPLTSRADLSDESARFVIPSFGWHPWFSYQIYDDRNNAGTPFNALEHYRRVLTPTPEDEDFLASLPTPKPLSEFLAETTARLTEHPYSLVGEVGLDRTFRLPVGPFHPHEHTHDQAHRHRDEDYTPGSREGRPLSPYHVKMDHQKLVLKAQLELAAKFQRPASLHSVQAHGVIFEVLQSLWAGHEKLSKRQLKRRRSVGTAHETEDNIDSDSGDAEEASPSCPPPPLPYPPRVCMHSYSGPVDPINQFLHHTVPCPIFFSFSTCINFSTPSSAKVLETIKAVPASQILIESDFHKAGSEMDDLLADILKKVCDVKGWKLQEGAEILRRNWEKFVFGE